RKKAPPDRRTRSSSASSTAMFSAPDLPVGSTRYSQSVSPTVRPSNSSVRLHRRTRTHQVAVSERRIDPADRRPDLVLAGRRGGKAGALARVGPVPGVDQQVGERVRSVLEQIVLAVGLARLDLSDFAANRDQRVDEAVELDFRLALRRLD